MTLVKNQNFKDLFSTLINQLWRLISGPITMLLIPLFLSPSQQGYWYLFSSLSALSIFADLGFSNIVMQFSAHEFAFLTLSEQRVCLGDDYHLKKLGSFFRFVIKWISSLCIIAFPIIYLIGIIFFYRDTVLSVYLLPWTIYTIGSLINFFNNSILSFIEGLNQIASVQKIRFHVAVINTFFIAILLILRVNIYALACAGFFSSAYIFISIFGTFKKLLKQLLEVSKGFSYSWRREISPLFVKYAISSVTVYIALYIYTPLMHLFHGPIYSGKVGLSFTLISAIYGVANIWIYTVTPRMNILVETKDWKTLDKLLHKRLIFSVITYTLIILSMISFFVIADKTKIPILMKITSRCFPLIYILPLAIAYFLNVFINAWGVYLAAHKQLPYLIPNILSTFMMFGLTLFIAMYCKPELFFVGTCITYIVFFFVSLIIFKKCRKSWHE